MTCRFGIGSITQAQITLNLLTLNSVKARIIKLDVRKSAHGCAYGIELEEVYKARAIQIFKKSKIKFSQA